MSSPAYIAGDFWRICDRCGFRYRSSQTYRTWDGLYVCHDDFETRHPQDFVRGRRDNQIAPHPRPEALDTIIGPLTTSISAAGAASDTTINVDSSVRFLAADHIGIALSDGNVKQAIVLSVPTPTSITLTERIGGSVSVGGIVINYSAVSEPDIG
ncbi:TPA: hypothetical protein O5T86_001243 [Staphylococcus aureus]|nr:hypothetical protein [Staphylococcus aureus]HDA7217700.1 hypothetical protein [Staphylococcus aureus]HDA7234979.1 hypothetical protein [Staphylococcus aureus]HDA7236782.1 hypothetical protein [Staphylococcus aureus]HDA7239207.1 hypothetical protein [Staphylococcus aureus]